ncbi:MULTISPECIES: alpha/beta hydrolase [Microbacterium]|uniref:alpha/beta hydrolase n=1 Tax=Microbacterium TaxID=33882 RepID=UPI00214B3D9E|nr:MULTISPECIES: alpha/beta hydrolase [unclassified Microbacterium]MCR2813063.1 alpha/beta hydrolase [Microbacterium sp. zg.Y1084]MDL5487294.1 alpha/beta hydrolase [Microbacterium sp. zg-Y1211]
MPLDPYFAERLRTHRRYLIKSTLKSYRARWNRWWAEIREAVLPRASSGHRRPAPDAVTAVPGATAAAGGGPLADGGVTAHPRAAAREAASAQPGVSHPRSARERHRRAALAWDRKELQAIGTPGPDLRTAEHIVPVRGFPSVKVRLYYPDVAEGQALPVWLTFFGGAFRIGGIDYPTTDAANRRRAADAGVVMAAVDYALAPEHRFPTQVEQAHAALLWLHENAASLGVDGRRMGVAGTSAGGSIAAALTIANRDRTHLPIGLQLLEVPVTDLTGRYVDLGATRALGIPSIVATREMRSIARTYLGEHGDARDPLASPMRAPSHEGLPDAVILTAQYDPLRSDGAAYGAKLRAAGVPASVVQYLGVTHDTPMFTGVLPAARRWHRDVVGTLRQLHAL